MMFKAAFKAIGDLASKEFRTIWWKSIGLSLLLFIAVFASLNALFWFLTLVPWPWLETAIAIGASLGLLIAFFFLMAPVTALFAGLYVDVVAEKVEQRHYAADPQGTAQSGWKSIWFGLQFGLLVLTINILALPLVFTGFGALALIVINAYLISREYFTLAAMRHLNADAAKQLRQSHGQQIFYAGFLPAVMAIVPILNLTVPLFATAYFVHIFKQVARSSA